MLAKFTTILLAWMALFAGLLAYWAYAESLEPGQQYADPWLPCIAVASGLTFAASVGSLIGVALAKMMEAKR